MEQRIYIFWIYFFFYIFLTFLYLFFTVHLFGGDSNQSISLFPACFMWHWREALTLKDSSPQNLDGEFSLPFFSHFFTQMETASRVLLKGIFFFFYFLLHTGMLSRCNWKKGQLLLLRSGNSSLSNPIWEFCGENDATTCTRIKLQHIMYAQVYVWAWWSGGKEKLKLWEEDYIV